MDILFYSLPDAWHKEESTASAIYEGLIQKVGKPLPWPVVRRAISGALQARLVELAPNSSSWPCGYPSAQSIKLRVPDVPPPPPPPPPRNPGVYTTEAELSPSEIQDLAERIGDVLKEAAGKQIKFYSKIELAGIGNAEGAIVERINTILQKINGKLRL